MIRWKWRIMLSNSKVYYRKPDRRLCSWYSCGTEWLLIKAVSQLTKAHEVQLVNYLKATRLEVGYWLISRQSQSNEKYYQESSIHADEFKTANICVICHNYQHKSASRNYFGDNLAKKKKQTKTIEINQSTSHLPRWLPMVSFVFLGILIFYPPFFRGLFFNEDMFLYHIITALVFILIWANKIYQKDYTFLKTPLDWAIFAYAGVYLLSLIGAVHPAGLLWIFKVLNYFMVFWMITQVVKNFKIIRPFCRYCTAAEPV